MPVEPWAATPGSFEVVGGGRSTVVQRHDFQVRTGILEGDEDRADAHPKTKAMFRSPEQDRTGASADTHAKKLGRLCVLASGYSGKAFDKFVGEAVQSVPVRDARTAIYRNASDHARSLASKVPAADDGRPGSVPADGIHPKHSKIPVRRKVVDDGAMRSRFFLWVKGSSRRARRRNGRAPLSGSSRPPASTAV